MKNKYFKISIASLSVALFTGVLLFGANSAFGAPTATPENSTAVAPTFGGLTSTGIIKSNGDIDIQGKLYKAGGGDVVVDDWLQVKGNIDVFGGNLSNTGTFGGVGMPLVINDDLKINEGLEIVKDLTVDNNIIAEKGLVVKGLANFQGTLRNTTSNNVYVDDSLTVAHFLKILTQVDIDPAISGGAITIGGEDLGAQKLKISKREILSVNSPLYINNNSGEETHIGGWGTTLSGIGSPGKDSDLFVKGDVQIGTDTNGENNLLVYGKTRIARTEDVNGSGNGAFKIGPIYGTPNKWLAIDNNEIATYGEGLYLNWDSGQKVWIGGGSATKSDLEVSGDIVAKQNITVTGKVKASGFGTYLPYSSAITIGAQSPGSASIGCNTGETLISCGASSGLYSNQLSGIYPSGNNCYAKAYNPTASSSTLEVKAICLDPDA